ncbi:MAG: hypothetical protein ACYC2W_03670 [Desulfurivibrionaceae bacterium]
MLTPRKLIAFLTLTLILSSSLVFADCVGLGSGWVQGTSSGGVDVCVPTGDNPTGAISSGSPVLTQNGKEYYAPPPGSADKLQVDSTTGQIARTLMEVTRITRADGSLYVYSTQVTFYTEVGASTNAVWDKAKAYPTSFPSLSAALSNNPPSFTPAVGVVFAYGPENRKITSYQGLFTDMYCSGLHVWSCPYSNKDLYFYSTKLTAGYTSQFYDGSYWLTSVTTDPVTPLVQNYANIASAVTAAGATGESEIDKLISQNSDSFKKSYTPSATEGYTFPPIPTALTPEKIAEIQIINGSPAGAPGGSPISGPGGTPQLPPTVEIPQTPPAGSDPTAPPPSDVYGPGYTPGFNNYPYSPQDGPGAVAFGNRFSQFMADLKGSSLFSLPTSILGNIPGSGTSAISFDGGEFGQQSFDFASFSNQLMIIRSVLLLCFALLSIRIVCLKR